MPPTPAVTVQSRATVPLGVNDAVPAVYDPSSRTLHVGANTESHAACASNSGLDPSNPDLRGLSVISDAQGNIRVLNGGSLSIPRIVAPQDVPAVRDALEGLLGQPVDQWVDLPPPPWMGIP
jgi:hypothetical protein